MSNKFFQSIRQPETVNLPVNGALLPGIFVTSDGAQLSASTAGTGRNLLLGNREFYDQDVTTAYADGETGVAYKLMPEDKIQALLVAGTYTYGQELTINASGQLAAAAATNVVVAFYEQAGATLATTELADVTVANSYVKA